MGIHDDHRQRVYNRFLKEGLANFEEHNAMEFLLFLAYKRGDTNELAHRLIDKYGSLARVLDASVDDLAKVPGIGKTSATILKFIPEMCAYYLENKNKGTVLLDSVDLAAEFFLPKFFGQTKEVFYIATVNDRRNLLNCTLISEGISNATDINLAKILSEALYTGTTGVLLAHNHPDGGPFPSSNDIILTQKVKSLLAAMNIKLLDHLIFANDDYTSLASTIFSA